MDIVNNTCVYLCSQKYSKTQKYYFAGENISNGKVHRKFTLFFLVCIQEGLNIHWEDFLWQSSLTWSFPLFFHLFEVLFAVLVELFEPQGLTGREGFLGSVRADWRLPWWRPRGLHNRNRCSLQLVKFDNLMRTQICYISSVFQFYLWILLKTYLWYIIFMKF